MSFTQSELRELFDYTPESGEFERKDKSKKRRSHTGTVNKRKHSDYAVLCVGGKRLYAHRAAWTFMNGPIPDGMVIDHIDGNGLNNCINNLRLVTKSINQRNRKNKHATHDLSGVYPHRGGFAVYFLNKYEAWKKDFFEAACIRKSLEANNHFLIDGATA